MPQESHDALIYFIASWVELLQETIYIFVAIAEHRLCAFTGKAHRNELVVRVNVRKVQIKTVVLEAMLLGHAKGENGE